MKKSNTYSIGVYVLDLLLIVSMMYISNPVLAGIFKLIYSVYIGFNIIIFILGVLVVCALHSSLSNDIMINVNKSVEGKVLNLVHIPIMDKIMSYLRNTVIIILAIQTDHFFLAQLTFFSSILLPIFLGYKINEITENRNNKLLNNVVAIVTIGELKDSINMFDANNSFVYEISENNEIGVITITFKNTQGKKNKDRLESIEHWKDFATTRLPFNTVLNVILL